MRWAPLPDSAAEQEVAIVLRLSNMINAFRHRGHFAANLDPLRGSSHKKLNPHEPIYWVNTDAVDVCRLLQNYPHSVDLSVFGLEGVDVQRRFDLSSEFLVKKQVWWTVMEVGSERLTVLQPCILLFAWQLMRCFCRWWSSCASATVGAWQ